MLSIPSGSTSTPVPAGEGCPKHCLLLSYTPKAYTPGRQGGKSRQTQQVCPVPFCCSLLQNPSGPSPVHLFPPTLPKAEISIHFSSRTIRQCYKLPFPSLEAFKASVISNLVCSHTSLCFKQRTPLETYNLSYSVVLQPVKTKQIAVVENSAFALSKAHFNWKFKRHIPNNFIRCPKAQLFQQLHVSIINLQIIIIFVKATELTLPSQKATAQTEKLRG